MPATPDTPAPETVLAFDYGLRRIGVASGQQITGSASAVATVRNGEKGPDWAHIDTLIAEWQPTRLIVGMPMHADGEPGSLADAVDAFCTGLERYGLPLETVDERHSSLEANRLLKAGRQAGTRGRIAKGQIDAAAAAVIAERWLAQTHLSERDDSE